MKISKHTLHRYTRNILQITSLRNLCFAFHQSNGNTDFSRAARLFPLQIMKKICENAEDELLATGRYENFFLSPHLCYQWNAIGLLTQMNEKKGKNKTKKCNFSLNRVFRPFLSLPIFAHHFHSFGYV